MNGKDLLNGLGYICTEYYEEAENAQITEESRGKLLSRPLVIAALIALMLLMMGSAVVWRLWDMKIGKTSPTSSSHIDLSGNMVISSEPEREVFTIHGVKGSPAYHAAQEWFLFKEGYDTDRKLMTENDGFSLPEAYEAYAPVYTQEMVGKIDEIADKYGLRLLGALAVFQRYESQVFYDALGIDSLLIPDSEGFVVNESGYFYEGGNFKITFDLLLSKGMEQWMCSMYYSKADCFDDVVFSLNDSDEWEQSVYTTKSGTEVHILSGPQMEDARFFHIREDAVISMGISGSFSLEALKRIADEIDFSITVESVDMELARATLEKFNPQPNESPAEPGYGSDRQKDFADFVRWHMEEENNISYPVTHYGLFDINGDGQEELLFGTEDKIYEIIEMTDNATRLWLMGNDSNIVRNHFSVCQNGIVLEYEEREANTAFTYRQMTSCDPVLENWDTKPVERVNYAPEGEYPYTRFDYKDFQYHPITEKEYSDIVSRYQVIKVEMMPLSQYSE